MKNKIVETINIPIYNTSVCCLIGSTVKDFEILYKDNKHMFDDKIYNEIKEDIENKIFVDLLVVLKIIHIFYL